jgi:hypothetical protein
MNVEAKCVEGDHVEVLLGQHWYSGVVEKVGRWSHSSGSSYPVYTVATQDGCNPVRVTCGNNSIRRKGADIARG